MNTAEIRELAERVWSEPWISRRSRLVTWSILNGLADRIDRGASDAAFAQVSGTIVGTSEGPRIAAETPLTTEAVRGPK